jgi:5'-phosphate synthase pdxT subunit
MGTCAGLIVLSKKVDNLQIDTLGLIDLEVSRNAYGRQRESFIDEIDIALNSKPVNFDAVFIRAPRVIKYGSECQVLAKYQNDSIMLRNESILVCSFHPELTGNNIIHKYFLDTFK